MRLRDMNIYQLSYTFFTPSVIFSTDERVRQANEWSLEDTSKEVFDPELSKEGLRTRQLQITSVCVTLLIIAVIIHVFTLFVLQGLFGVNIYTKVFFVIPQYLMGTGIHIALFRGCRASWDEVKFMRSGQPEDFVPSTRVPIRWYDFIAAIPFGLLALLW